MKRCPRCSSQLYVSHDPQFGVMSMCIRCGYADYGSPDADSRAVIERSIGSGHIIRDSDTASASAKAAWARRKAKRE